jgi:peptide/nickel transport system permease protein
MFIDAIWAHDWSALWDVTKHLILPATTLGIVIGGIFIRLVRVNVIRSLKDDYVEAARARGIGERAVVFRHAFRNALVPVVTIVGLQLALLLGGAILTEETFNWPGIGSTLVKYLENRDYAGVQGIVVVFALVVVLASLVIDFVNAFIDPRIRY